MRSQITDLTRNLMWTRSGTVWAVWRMTPQPYGYRPDEKKIEVRAMHTALFRVLSGEALMLGVCSTTDPAAVVEAMMRGVDLEQHPEWAQECEATLDMLEGIALGSRTHWLAVPLPNPGSSRVTEPMRSAMSGLRDSLAMPRTGPSPQQVTARLAQAEAIRSALPAVFEPRPATVAEVVWLHLHAQQRGLGLDLTVPAPGQTEEALLSSPAAIASPVLDPAGQTDTPTKGNGALTGLGLLSRRYLKVISTDTEVASYQSSLVMTGTPAGGVQFPGGEWLGSLDRCGEDVDWALRLNIRSRAEVTQRNIKAARNLNDQVYQRSGNAAAVPTELGLANAELSSYRELLAADSMEVEVEATAIFTVGGPTPAACEASARRVAEFYAEAGFKLSIDATGQEALWWAGLPGPTSRIVHELSQIAPAHHFAASVPVVTNDLGDDRGALVALGLSTGRPQPVLVDLAGSGTSLDVAMAVACVGELGAGKSVFMKALALAEVDRGASLVAIDRTPVGEWGAAVAGVPGAVVVDVSERAQHSLDPLRVFPPASAGRIAQSFLTALLNMAPTSDVGILLNEVLDPGYMREHGITSLGALVRHLEGNPTAGADKLARTLHVFSRKDLGRALFDESLPPIDLHAPVLVFWTHLLQLPKADELNIAHRFAQMSVEKVFGRAVYALLAGVARERCFRDPAQLDLFAVDEAHSVTCSPESMAELTAFLRDGRKHKASLIIGTHDPYEDLPDEVLRRLIPFRVLMRHRDRGLAARGLHWVMGLKPEEHAPEDLIRLITEDTSPVDSARGVETGRRGECLIRDFRARIGRAKVLLPRVEQRAASVQTTPTGGHV
ncbi:ATP-binding protein [uncultured Cellulomonas sp.]|uniref:ATP-binding protein n=1 Tax=uncultured Cellulomonas sp. TaxID=189682 RepID=UPI00261E569A|nr:ATP-binding protein [uncultured Cellulomonas sp.]